VNTFAEVPVDPGQVEEDEESFEALAQREGPDVEEEAAQVHEVQAGTAQPSNKTS
jgi:hypothetical protein